MNARHFGSAVFAVAVFLAACGGGGGASREEVEGMIRSQLPESLRRNAGQAVFVNGVTCVAKGDNEFDCLASVTGTDGVGRLQSLDIPVTATCDDENCTWRTTS